MVLEVFDRLRGDVSVGELGGAGYGEVDTSGRFIFGHFDGGGGEDNRRVVGGRGL